MEIILIPLLTLFVTLLCHVFIWRLARPQSHIVLVLAIFIGLPLPILACLCFWFAPSAAETILSFVGYFALAGVYVQTYPAIQTFSPSLQMVLLIGKARGGLSPSDLETHLAKSNFNMDRFDDLIRENFVFERGGSLFLSRKGRLLARLFVDYRNFLNLPAGAG